MNKKKTTFVFGTRPELIKLAPLIKEAKNTFEIEIVSTGQHQELLTSLYKWFDFQADLDFSVLEKLKAERKNISVNSVISKILDHLESAISPQTELIIVQGDTASAFAGALAGFLKKIPVAHIEAGLRTNKRYDPFPEEIFRAQISVLSSFHFVPTEFSKKNLEEENIQENVFVVGNTVIDALKYTLDKLKRESEKLDQNLFEEIEGLEAKKKKLFLITMHRRENFGEKHLQIAKTLNKITEEYPEVLIFFPIHPNPEVKEVLVPVLQENKAIRLIAPLDYLNFVYLMSRTDFILTDSGGIQEEASFLGKPLFVLRESTERPEILSEKNAILLGTDPDYIFRKVSEVLDSPEKYEQMCHSSKIFGQGDSAKKITEILDKIL